MKTFSKITAIALMAVMTTTCLTACEEDSVPAYGTIIDETNDTAVHHQIVTEPRYEEPQEVTQGADFMLVNALIEQGSDGYEHLVLYTGVTNLTDDTRNLQDTVSVVVMTSTGTGLSYCQDSLSDYDHDDLNMTIDSGEQVLGIYAVHLPPTDLEYVIVRAYDLLTEEVIFETTISLTSE